MKKNIVAMLCIACMLPVLVCTAFANEGYAIHPRQALPENIINLLTGDSSIVLLDCDPTSGNIQYISWVSYDYLSELSTSWKTAGVVVYNSTMKAYFIRVSFVPTTSTSGNTYEYCALGTTNGYVLGARSSSDDTGNSSDTLNRWVNRIAASVEQIQTQFNLVNLKVNYIQGYAKDTLAALNSVISNGLLLVDNSDVVNAIENITISAADNTDIIAALGRIETQLGDLNVTLGDLNITGSEFDDTDIINAIQNIPAYDDSGLISAVDNVSNIIVEQFGKNESQVNLPYIAGSASGVVRGVRLDSFESIDLASKSNVYVSESPVYRAGVTRNKTVVDDLLFSAAGASEPADMIGSLSFTEMVFTAVPTKAHPMVYTYSLEISKSQLDAFGVGYGDCIWRDITIPVMKSSCILYNARIPINGQTSTTYIASMEFEPRWDASGEWLGWCDDTDTVYESMGEPTRLYHHSEVDMSSGIWYLYSTLTSPYDVVYSSRFTAFLQAQFDRVVDASGMAYDDTNVIAAVNSVESALSNLSLDVGDVTVAPADLTPVITSIDAVGVNIEDLNANFNTSLGSLVDKLDVIVDKSSESMENLTVEISVDNEAHNVFYVTDEDGNEESLVDFSGDVLKAGGKLLNFLFKVCFDGAIDNLDGSIDDMDSFYFDGAELGGSLWE